MAATRSLPFPNRRLSGTPTFVNRAQLDAYEFRSARHGFSDRRGIASYTLCNAFERVPLDLIAYKPLEVRNVFSGALPSRSSSAR